jgi:hypothetical protein
MKKRSGLLLANVVFLLTGVYGGIFVSNQPSRSFAQNPINYVDCDSSSVSDSTKEQDVEIIIIKTKYLATQSGQILYRFLPSKRLTVKERRFDGDWQPEWMRSFISDWVPLCGNPKSKVVNQSKLTRQDRSKVKTARKYKQVVYNNWPLYYYKPQLLPGEDARVPKMWDFVPIDAELGPEGTGTGGGKINAGP